MLKKQNNLKRDVRLNSTYTEKHYTDMCVIYICDTQHYSPHSRLLDSSQLQMSVEIKGQ